MRRAVFTAIFVIGGLLSPLSHAYSGGSGTAADPYQIVSKADLLDLASTTADYYKKYFILMSDIDMGGQTFTAAIIAPDTNNSGTSFDGTLFKGVFDGRGHKIKNFTINGGNNDYLGLFGSIGSSGQVINLGIENCTVNNTSDSNFAGILAGENGYPAKVRNCYSRGSVNGTGKYVGGLIGRNSGLITDCYSTASGKGSSNVGGLAGSNEGASIYNCYSTGYVNGSSMAGGLVGSSSNAWVYNSFWDIQTSQQASSAGGEGKTTVQMKTLSTFTSATWDFSPSWIDGDLQDWILTSEGTEYPKLRFQNPSIYNGGSGSESNPYVIADRSTFLLLSESWWDWDKHFVLTNDIDMGGLTFSMAIIAPDIDSAYQYFQGELFLGTFDGAYHKITNFTINGAYRDYLGLFGYLGNGGKVEKLGIENYTVSGSADSHYIGGLVGYSNYGSNVSYCYSTGNVSGDYYVGGLVGECAGKIFQCCSTGVVSGTSDIGGLVGYNYTSSLSQCYSTGAVSGTFNVGGLVGNNYSSSLSQCYSMGAVSGTSNVGGLIGYINNSSDSITCSFWDIQASGQATSAGGIGKTTIQMKDINTFLAEGWDFVGEVGRGTCNYWHMSQEGFPVLSIFYGYIPLELIGRGTEDEPYIITDANDFGTIWYRPAAYYVLANNIDLTGIQWGGAVISEFYGHLDGKGFSIRNLSIYNRINKYLGLFGYIDTGSQVKNLGLENCIINGNKYTGGLAGYNSGSISYCYSTGILDGSSDAGGLVGSNSGSINNCYSTVLVSGSYRLGGLTGINSSGHIIQCYSTSKVSGSSSIGGLVGYNSGNIELSYATGTINGSSFYIGGFVGWNYSGTINQCYSVGAVSGVSSCGGLVGYKSGSGGSVSNSFWDIQNSGQISSAGGTGKNAAEMKMLTTFTGVGWDFVGETANGSKDYWRMRCEGMSNPRLNWQIIPTEDWNCPDGVNAEDLAALSACWMETIEAKSDIDADGSVNLNDYIKIAQQWMLTGCGACGGADVTDDGNVDELDLILLAQQWLLQENTACQMADLNDNGQVDLADFAVFAQHWLQL